MSTVHRWSRRAASAAAALALMLTTGCATPARAPEARPADVDARTLPMLDGRTADAIGWDDLMEMIAAADVVILGEQHNDAVGHAVQLAVVEDVLDRWPGSAVSLEMLERDEQTLVDDYMDDVIDAEQLAELTFSTRWAGSGSWTHWYQPVIDAAKQQDSPVVAANAPRRYVRLARTDGYDRLAGLPDPRRGYVEMPEEMPEGRYRERFWSVMGVAHDADLTDEASDEDSAAEQERVESLYRSQLVWDATMADSIAEARRRGAPKVVHLVGQFHCDFEGGLVQELRRRLTGSRVVVVSLQSADGGGGLREEDRDRADVVVYTD
ncbi:MAG: ChaN family lipoprotein [Planctomycetota bacterium]|jgi:uncharacterized iron-regulated protein